MCFTRMVCERYDNTKVGMSFETDLKITEEELKLYAKSSGDYNPLHANENYAKKSILKGNVIPGVLLVAILTNLIRKDPAYEDVTLILLNINFDFINPVHVGETIKARLEIVEKYDEKRLIKSQWECKKETGELIMEGFTLAKMLD